MTLRKKTLTIIAVTSVSLIAVLYVISRVFLLGGHARLEEQSVHRNVERALSALSEKITVLDATVFDWAAWNDTYAFIEDRNPDYVQSNLTDETFLTIRLNLILFVDASGERVFAKGFDLHNETEVPVPQAFLADPRANDLLLSHHETESSVTGIVLLSEGPMLVASRPILTSEDKGPIRGALVMGHYLDTTEIERLAQVTHLSFTVQRFNDSLLPSDFQEARVALSGKERILVRPTSDESIAGYALLEDIYGEPTLFLRVDMPREIYKQGKASIVVFTLLFLAASLVFGTVTLLLLERQVLSRLARLARSVSGIGTRGDLSARVAMGETDEVSQVVSSVNEMLSELEQSEKALRQQASQLQIISDVGRRISAILNLDELLPLVTTTIAESFGFYHVDVFLVESASGYAVFAASNDPHVKQKWDEADLRVKIGQEGLIGWVAEASEAVLANDVAREPRYLPDPLLADTRSELVIPLKIHETSIGVLDINSNQLDEFSPSDAAVLQTLANQIAIAIENARLFDEASSRAERLAVVNHIARAVGSSLQLDELMEIVYHELTTAFDNDALYLSLYDEKNDELDFLFGVEKGQRLPRKHIPLGGWSAIIVREKKPLHIRDFEQERDSLRLPEPVMWGDATFYPSWLGVPMRVGERVIGVITVMVNRPYAYSDEDKRLLVTIADQVAVAVENARLYEAVREELTERKRAEAQLRETLEGTIVAIGQTTETRDLYTSSHQKRVTELSTAIAREMKLSEEKAEGIRVAGLLHDIGKLAIPAEILSKPSQLSEIEYALFKAHPRVAYDILKAIDFPWPVAQIVLQHHERMDGSGYPQGLKGDEILVEARILAVADVVEAMASHRPYRPSLGIDKALEEIAQYRSTLYDAVIVDACLRLFDERKFSFEDDPLPGKAQRLTSPDSSVSPQ